MFYIGAEGGCEEGKTRNNKLRKEYPDHPSFNGIDKNGLTKIQKMYYRKVN